MNSDGKDLIVKISGLSIFLLVILLTILYRVFYPYTCEQHKSELVRLEKERKTALNNDRYELAKSLKDQYNDLYLKTVKKCS